VRSQEPHLDLRRLPVNMPSGDELSIASTANASALRRWPGRGHRGGADPFTSVQSAVRDGNFDEIIISTLSKKTSKWLRQDLSARSKAWGCP
jgi:hypothetical protein